MPNEVPSPDGLRILVLAPSRSDGEATCRLLAQHGLAAAPCRDLDELCREITRGAGVAIVTDEAIRRDRDGRLAALIKSQPAWSDFPLVVLAPPLDSPFATHALAEVGHMTLVRRPVEVRTLVSTVQAALRDRTRQYARRDDLAERARQAQSLAATVADLRASEERYRTLADNVHHLFWTCRPDGRCDYLSRQWVTYTGIAEVEQLDLLWLDRVIHPDDRERTLATWMAAVEDRAEYDLEFRIRGADGQYRWFKTRGTPIREPSGAIAKWFGTCTDIDAQVRAEAALRDNDLRKNEFLAMLAHELRNPLSSIAGATDLARRSGSAEDRAWADDVINRQVRHLSRLIDDLLDVSRITQGKIRLQLERLDILGVLEHAVETVGPLMRERRHDLKVTFGPGMWIEGDATRLEQVVVNLLTNAAKYTPAGGHIRLETHVEPGWVAITVADDGLGIPPERLPEMFELFAQGERSIARSEGGLGIGLTLVKNLVEMHGGAVTATSEGPDRGSAFTVRLPASAKPAPAPQISPRPATAPASTARVLVVDDNVDTATGMARLLKFLGHDVRTAHDGLDAIAEARRHRPQVVLLDIGLPGMDGYQVARALRDEGFDEAILIAVSGYGEDQAIARSRACGFDHHLVKPVDMDSLVTLVTPPA